MSATIDYIQPYGILAQQHKDGLDAIITSIGSGGPSTVSVDDIIDAVFDYMETTFFGGSADPDDEVNFKAGIANAMNGYLQNGGSSPYLRTLQSIPATALANGFDRLADALPAARSLKGGADGAQMVQALGQADAAYWANQIATTGSWTPYLNGNAAIDTANVPFWVDAAMFGAQFSYGQLPGTDLDSVGAIIIGVLSGSLATAAGKVVFGWVPRNVGAANEPVIVSEDCDCGGDIKMMNGELSQIGRPVGGVSKANTNWHQPGTGRSGTDYRYYNNRKPCLSLHNYGWAGSNLEIEDGCSS